MADSEGHSHGLEADAALPRTLDLKRVLGLSIGAMIGSGIFVLPGLAFKVAGPAIIVAYVVAGLVVLPALFSNAEMATAMPAAGGTYLYIDRAMGPLLGTVAGFGVWFSLTFKAAFALVGLGAYVSLYVDADARLVGMLIALGLIALNLVGVHQSTGFEAALVAVVLVVLAGFAAIGAPSVDSASFEPLLSDGAKSLFSAAALVFVSYIGVTQIASIAEEIRDPGQTIPRAMLISIAVMILVYPAVVAVIVGVTPAGELAGTSTPVATAAEQFLGGSGVVAISIIAIVALISMGNAGLIASARYPYAMARNQLAPAFLQRIGQRSGAPTAAIIATGAVLIGLILFVPLLELAKLASAFQLLVFAFVNLALISFRESQLDWYQPTFRSPAYPYTQIFGIVASIGLLTQIGLVPSIGAALIIVAGLLWYRGFGQMRASRESATRDALRSRAQDRLVAETTESVAGDGFRHILVALRRPSRLERQQHLIRMALHLVASEGQIHVIRFDDSPASVVLPADFERASARDVGITIDQNPAGNRRGAIHLYAAQNDVDLVLADLPQELRATRHVVRDWRWLRDHLPGDSAFMRNRHITDIRSIVILGTGGPYDPLKINIASRIAKEEGASLRLVHVVQEAASAEQVAVIEDYHGRLIDALDVPADSRVEAASDLVATLSRLSRGANLVVLGAPSHRFSVVTDLADRVAEQVDCPALLIHTPVHEAMSLRRRLIERFIS